MNTINMGLLLLCYEVYQLAPITGIGVLGALLVTSLIASM